ncbi:hypothetical protein N7510_006290 [Penicillium lagena]|uniref:uncharacterized protein n=1 Tax=Penicillium lagena TaxID=94218 RepID=UPI0025409A30|nr:uncharacterized protein N7510_006290 [Penicillium lagena]KAJ5613096.1 hypothetical protein N7510_006290 [Penicillium lagena]
MPGRIGTPEEWRAARSTLLAKEIEHARTAEAIKAELRALPMVPVAKTYIFQSPDGPTTLRELFGTKSQLIVYHYMFEPTAEEGCHGCAFMAANFPDLRHLADKDTALIAVSRAPIEKITRFKDKNFWKFPWVSSNGSDFNYDFHVTLDEKVAPVEYDFRRKEELDTSPGSGEQPGLSVFKLEDGVVYHTYSSYYRLDSLAGTYVFLDLTPAGRQMGPNGPAEFKTPAEYDEESKKSG